MKQMKMMRDDKKAFNFVQGLTRPIQWSFELYRLHAISLLCAIYVIESCCFLGMYDCHVESCEDSVEGFIGHITPTPVSHFVAEFREVDSRPIPRVK